MLDFEKFDKSLSHLKAQFDNYLNMENRPELSLIDKEAIMESVVQRFEICYDCLWKTLKQYLSSNMGIPDMPNSPKPILKIAFENKLIENIEKWLSYANARVETSHDYSSSKAQISIELAGSFITDAGALLEYIKNTA